MIYDSKNNNRNNDSMNTKGLQFYGAEGKEKSTLIVGHWNELVSLKLHPVLEESKRTSDSKYNYSESIQTSLSPEKCSSIIESIDKFVIPSINEKKQCCKGVIIKGNSLVLIGNKVVDDESVPFIAILKDIDPETRKPESSLDFDFKPCKYIDDYNLDTGEFNVGFQQSDFNLFVSLLRESLKSMSNAVAHSIRNINKFKTKSDTNVIYQIAEKVGVETKYGKKSYGMTDDIFNSNSSSEDKSGGYKAETTYAGSFDEMSDEIPF